MEVFKILQEAYSRNIFGAEFLQMYRKKEHLYMYVNGKEKKEYFLEIYVLPHAPAKTKSVDVQITMPCGEKLFPGKLVLQEGKNVIHVAKPLQDGTYLVDIWQKRRQKANVIVIFVAK